MVSLSSHRQLAVAFVHQSAKDYLLQSTLAIRIGDSESNHKMIADRLLRYLRNGCLDSNVFLNFARFKAFPLAGYAIPCWEYHFSQIVNISPLMKEHDTFFGTNTTLRGPWIDHSDMGRILFGHCGSQEHDIPLLHLACVMGLENLVRHILYGPKWMFVDRLRRKTTVNRQWGSYRYTPLHWATEYGHLGIIRMLLDCGASADKANFDEKTPFHHVLRSNHSDAFKILAESKSGKALLEAGNGSELSQHNLLYHAAANGRTEICRLLIEDYKWDSNTKSSRHAYSPIDIAIICGHIPLARTFATRWGGRCHKHFNVLHSLTFDGPSSSYRIMVNNIMRSMDQMHSPASTIRKEAFVASFKSAVHEWKLDINDTDMNGRNILQGWVLTFKNLDFFSVQVRTALTHGVDPGHRDKKGRATIHLLSQRVDFPKVVVELEVLSLLLDKERLPINATDKLGRTMLHIYFREALGRANENDPEKLYPWFDRPASDYELSQFMPAMVERLLDHGLNRHLKSSTGKTALDLAQRVLDSYLLPAEMLGNLASTLSVDSLPQRRQKFINAPPDFFLPEHREEFISIIEDVVDILKNYETVPVE